MPDTSLTPAEIAHNTLYLACAIHAYPDKFQENGAVAMNHMIQERAGLTRAEAFKVVSDAIQTGLVRLMKGRTKQLMVVEEAFKPFRDLMIDRIGRVQAEVVTFNWQLHRPKQLSENEQQDLVKHVAKGRLWDLKKGLPDRLAEQVVNYFEHVGGKNKHVRNPFDAEKSAFASSMSDAILKFSKAMSGKDFILVVTRCGDTIKPAMKIVERESKVSDF